MTGNDETMPPTLVDWELAGDDTDKEGKPKTRFERVQKVETKEGTEKLPAEMAWCCWELTDVQEMDVDGDELTAGIRLEAELWG